MNADKIGVAGPTIRIARRRQPAAQDPVLPAILIALLAAAICFAWLFLNTHFLFSDNWTSVFYTGQRTPMPPALAAEHIYQFPGVVGYDAQFYHLIAHDPLFKRNFSLYIDDPRLRYRRILVSALAALLSFGHSSWVDPAYIAVMLAFVYLGAFWLARWSQCHGLSPACGLLFLFVPATLVTMLLMILDGALAALAVGAFYYAEREKQARLFIVFACAALVRETGILLLAGYCFWLLFQGKLRRCMLFATAAVPLFVWLAFVQVHTAPARPQTMSVIPFLGLYRGIVGHFVYRQPILTVLDFVAMGATLLAFALTVASLSRPETRSAAAFMASAFVLLGVFLADGSIWPEANSFGRLFSPVLLFIAMTGLSKRSWWQLAPMALVDVRIGLILLFHLGRIVQAALLGRS